MTKLFDLSLVQKINKQRKLQIGVYSATCVVMITAIVLSCVFVEQMQRPWAQTIATVCAIIAGCYTLFFAREQLYNNKLIGIAKASAAESEELIVTVAKYEKNITTYRFLPFHIVDVTTNDNEQRRLYLYEGSLAENKSYTVTVSQNIICSYEENYE